MKKFIRYSFVISLLILFVALLSLPVSATNTEITIQKTAGTTISIPQYTNETTIIITGDSLETNDWTAIRGLNSATFHLVIRGNTTGIPNNALQNNTRLLSIVAEKATHIGSEAFTNCSSLMSAEFPLATTVGNWAFNGAGNVAGSSLSLPALTTIPNGIVGNHGIFHGTQFRHIDISNVTSIGNLTFSGLIALETVSAPKATHIGNSAFSGCAALKVIELPDAPPTFGTNVFSGISNPLVVGTLNAATNYNLTIAPWPTGTIGVETHAINIIQFNISGNLSIIPNISYTFTPVSWQRLSAGSWTNLGQTSANYNIASAQVSDAGLYRFNFRIGSHNYSLFYRLEEDDPTLLTSITRNITANTEFTAVCSFTNITLSNDSIFRIRYNPAQVELVDFAAQTQGLIINAGLVQGTDLEILYHNTITGELIFKVNKSVPPGQPWSGVVTMLRFKAKITGNTTIFFEQL